MEEYISKYSNGKVVSAAQYITEIICERKALINKEDLHYRFWLQSKWEVFYRNQIGSAHKLLKKYSSKSIIRALNTDKGKKIYSLRAPHLPPIIEEQEVVLKSENQNLNLNLQRKENVSFPTNKATKNIISKLKGLDYES
jgi:hypothetical protein